jgi:hypothetical protein
MDSKRLSALLAGLFVEYGLTDLKTKRDSMPLGHICEVEWDDTTIGTKS